MFAMFKRTNRSVEDKKLVAEYGEHSIWFSFAKGFTYRFFGTFTSFCIAFFLTGDVSVGLKFGALEFCSKIFVHAFHNQLWVWGVRTYRRH